MGKVFGVSVVVGIPSFGMVSTYFMQARVAQGFPLVSSAIDKIVLNKPIAEARNEIVEFALSQGANYIYWLDDDVIAPPDAFLKLYRHQKDIVNGVYWSKSNPPMPLLFRGHLQGPYWNWHVGDLIEIDAAGNGLTLVKTDVYRTISEKVGGPWYSTDYLSFAGVSADYGANPPNNTEDLYFYWKAKKAGFKIWADTSVQAMHYDKYNKVMYGMPSNAPQAHPVWEIKAKGDKLIADIGSGPVSPYMRDEGEVVSFDIREDIKPDVICDVRHLPVPSQTFDVVFSSHTLEHFSYTSVDRVLREWARILKVGGELRLVVPNLKYVGQRLANDTIVPPDLWVIYGEQDYPKNFHAAGFTPNLLRSLVESLDMFEDIEILEGKLDNPPSPEAWNLYLRAKKVKHPELENITPEDIVKPEQSIGDFWPIRVYQDYNERPITPEEMERDTALAKEPVSAIERKQKIIGKSNADLAIFPPDHFDDVDQSLLTVQKPQQEPVEAEVPKQKGKK